MSLKMIVADRRFWPLFWTQFIGALNDNVFKNALVMMVTFQNVTVMGLDKAQIVALSGGLFILPFFLFSPVAGQISDKMEKSRLIRLTKYWEVLIMLLACFGFYTHQFGLLLVVLFLAGVQAALFGPVKYSMIPDLVRSEELISANAYVEMGTFLAILIGTIAGGLLVRVPGADFWIMGTLLSLAIAGAITAVFVKRVEIAAPDLVVRYNPFVNFRSLLAIVKEQASVYNSILGISWFWFFGAAVLSILPIYCKDYLNVDEGVVTCFLAMFTVGIGLGSILCEKLSFGRVELGLVPIGSLGMSIFLFDLFLCRPFESLAGFAVPMLGLREFLAGPIGLRLMIDFFLMSVFGGFFILPLYTLIQERCLPGVRSRVIAANNILNAVYMVMASLTVMAFNGFHLSFPVMFLILAGMNLVAALYIYLSVPEFMQRLRAWAVARLMARLQVEGEAHIPKSGGAILVLGRLQPRDRLFLMAGLRRSLRFIGDEGRTAETWGGANDLLVIELEDSRLESLLQRFELPVFSVAIEGGHQRFETARLQISEPMIPREDIDRERLRARIAQMSIDRAAVAL